jgi:hypothetical protein
MQKGPPMRQISLAAWTRTPAGIKGFAWRILPPGPADSFRMTDNQEVGIGAFATSCLPTIRPEPRLSLPQIPFAARNIFLKDF